MAFEQHLEEVRKEATGNLRERAFQEERTNAKTLNLHSACPISKKVKVPGRGPKEKNGRK